MDCVVHLFNNWGLTEVTPVFAVQAFTDSHMLMSTLGAKNEELTMKLLNSLKTYVRYSIIPDMTGRRLRVRLGRWW